MKKTSPQRQLGLITVISLVAGGMIGSGIFTLPAALAQFGGISLLGWVIAAIGATSLAAMMGKLSKVIPEQGGSYAYTKRAFGKFPAFLVAWGFWLSVWSTNSAISLSFAGYFSVFFPKLQGQPWFTTSIALLVIWGLTILNSLSIRGSGNLQVVTTLLKIIPILIIAIGGLFVFDINHFIPLNISEVSSIQAITTASVLCFFAFMGIEAATIPAENIKNPEKNISKGTLIGVGLVVFLYLFSSISLFGILPPSEVAQSTAPFTDAANQLFGTNTGFFIAIGACISTLGALNVWILVQGQISNSMARDGLLPKSLAFVNKHGSPSTGIILSSSVISVLLLFNSNKGFGDLYSFMVLLTSATSLLFYIAAAFSFLKFSIKSELGFKPSFRNISLSFIGLGFGIWILLGSGKEALIWGGIGVLLGIPIYLFNRKNDR
ncbi:amino acid permease [Algoriphagus sp. NBT04N3]|uniref:APC family permease n=2 Tax=unclassified Algoriphagus TaxID=2641541 RepID=UPI001C62CBF6|nr:amino acid permease [Algoriphagus sp. NBT04N3]QYH38440.1 amino acid permease [Algoriphagus sp. NBT04N3]